MSKKWKLIICIILIYLFGLVFDIQFKNDIYLIEVRTNYIDSVFAAIFTVSALSLSILTIIVTLIEKKIFGFKIKEIINFHSNELKFDKLIPYTLILVLVSLFFYTFNLINLLTSTLVSLIVLLLYFNSHVFKIIFLDKYSLSIIFNELKLISSTDNLMQKENLILKLLESLKQDIKDKNKLYSRDYLSFIKKIVKSFSVTENTTKFINQNLVNLFIEINQSLDFYESIEIVFTILNKYKSHELDYHKSKILKEIVKKSKHFNEIEFSNSKIYDYFNNFLIPHQIDESYKEDTIMEYFESIYFNKLLSTEYKASLLKSLFKEISMFSVSNLDIEIDYIRQKVILHIFKDYIVFNENEKEKEELLSYFINYFYLNFGDNSIYIETISIIYYSLYVYSQLEDEIFTDKFRLSVKNILYIRSSKIQISNCTLNEIIANKLSLVIKALWQVLPRIEEEFSFLDYYPDNIFSKRDTWSNTCLIRFAFYNFIIFSESLDLNPFTYFPQWDEKDSIYRSYLVNELISCFDKNTKSLSKNSKLELDTLEEWIRIKCINHQHFNEIYVILNDEMKKNKFNQEKIKFNTNRFLSNSRKELTQYYNRMSEFYNVKLTNKNGFSENIKINPTILNLQDLGENIHFIPKIKFTYNVFLNKFIKNKVKTIIIKRNIDSVVVLIDLIKKYNLNNINFEFPILSYFGPEIAKHKKFERLNSLIKDLDVVKGFPVNYNIIFKKGAINYKYNLLNVVYDSLNEDDIKEYLDNNKIADYEYRISGVILDKISAMEKLSKNFVKELIEIEFLFNLNEEEIYILEIDYDKFVE